MTFRLAWQTIRERRAVFFGSVAAVVLGTLVLTGAVSLIVAVAESEFAGAGPNAKGGVIALLVFVTVVSAFLSVFLVASTVSFSVAMRGREMALFRVVGATSKQVRRLVRTETTIVALFGASIGLVLGFGFGAAVAALLGSTSLARGLEFSLSSTMIAVAGPIGFGVGVVVTFLGARAAARRVARIPLMVALTEVDLDRDAMPVKRWVFSLLFLAGGVLLMVLVSGAGSDALVPLGIFLGFPLVLCAGLLAPVLVRPFSAGFAALLTRFAAVGGWLAAHTVRQSVRRSAAATAPVLLVVGVAGSILGTAGVFGSATQSSMEHQYRSDIVVAGADHATAEQLRGVSGVADVARVAQVELRFSTDGAEPDRSVTVNTVSDGALTAVFDLRELTGDDPAAGIVAGRSTAATMGWELGQEVTVERADGERTTVPVTAVHADNPLQENVIVPAEVAGATRPEQTLTHVVLDDDADVAAVTEDLRAAASSPVETTAAWAESVGDGQSAGLRYGAWVLAGLALVYAGLSVVNTTFISFRDRREEFRQLATIGATSPQIRRMVGWESAVVAGIGALIGAAIAITTSAVLSGVLGSAVPQMSVTLPIVELALLAVVSVGLAVAAGQLAVPRGNRVR